MRILNLDEPVADDVRLPPSRAGGHYRSLLAIARLGGRPLASVAVPVDEHGRVSRGQLELQLHRQLDPELRSVFSNRGGSARSRSHTASSNGNLSRLRVDVSGRRARLVRPKTTRARRPSVSVVVTTCCNPVRLSRCLRSILASDCDDFEVIVVENRPGSVATREMLAEQFANSSRLRYVEEPRRGLSWARNAGLAAADGELVAFTDDDVIVDPAWIRRSAETFELRDDVACVTGLILPLELETDTQVLLEQFMALSKGFSRQIFCLPESLETHPLLPYTPGAVGSGANTVLRADIARDLGGFDPRLGTGTPAAGGEDLDLYIRLLRGGHAVAYEPGAIVWHAHPSGASKLRRQVYWYGVGLGATLAKRLFAGPERRQLLRAVPAGIRYGLDPGSRKNAGKTKGNSRRLDWLERLGIAAGPVAYLTSVLRHVCLGLVPQRRGNGRPLRSARLVALDSGQIVDVLQPMPKPVARAPVRPAGRKRPDTRTRPAERVVLASALAACLVAPPFVALDAPAGLRFAAALALFCLAPGAALLSTLRGRAEFGLVLGASLGTSAVLACSMLWLGTWNPDAFLYGLSAVCLAALLPALRRAAASGRGMSVGRVRSAAAGVPASVVLHGALLTAATAAWLASLAGTNLGRIAGLGLVNALPPAYFLAFALLLFGFAAAITSDQPRPVLLGAYTIALVVLVHGSTPLLYQEPRYQWVYNHLAVIDLIAKTGAVNRHVDIYNNWPGFFALNAWLSTVSGVKPATYAPWAQPFFNLANIAALRFALRGLSRDERLLWSASWLFLLGNWVGQDYLAPQAFAFALSLVIIGVCLRCGPRPRQPRLRVGRWWAMRLDQLSRRLVGGAPVAELVADPPLSARAAVIVGGVCYFAVVVSHQLTPVVVIIDVVALSLIARTLPWWVAVAMMVVEVWWVALAWSYVGAHFSLLELDPLAGTTPTGAGVSGGLAGHDLVTDAARLVVVAMVALAGIGVVRRLRTSLWDLRAAILALAPALVVEVQSYGGEARYRSYLFALPWLCFFAAAAVAPRMRRMRRMRRALRPLRIVLVSAAVGACTLLAYFGLEYINDLAPDDVAAGVWFDQHAPPNSLFVTVTPNAVSRVTARYAIVSDRAYTDSPALTDQAGFVGHSLGRKDLPAIEAALRRYGVTPTFLVLTESEQHYARLYGLLPGDWRANLDDALRSSPSFRLVYQRGTSEIFEFTPPPPVGARR